MTTTSPTPAVSPPRNHRQGRQYSLHHLLTVSGLILFAVAAVALWIVVAAQVKISEVAADTRDNVLPVIVTRQEVARDVERLILFGEELLNSSDPGRRRQARLSAQVLVYNEAGFRSDDKIKKVGLRTLNTLTGLSALRDQRDELNTEAFKLLMGMDDSRIPGLPHQAAGQEGWESLLIQVMSSDADAALDDLGGRLHALLKRSPSQTVALTEKVDRLIALRREVIEIDRNCTVSWERTTRELKSVTDMLAVQAQQLTSDRFSEIQRLASQAENVGLTGLVFILLVVAAYGVAAHRFFIHPLVQATASLEQALQGEVMLQPPKSAISEVRSIVVAATTLVENTRTIEEERRKVLSARLDAAESASRMKSGFLATMGHELRTPMNGVLGMAQLLKLTDLTDEQKDEVDTIISSATALQGILADILEFIAAEDGQVMVRRAPCCFRDLLNKARGELADAAQTKQVDIRIEVATDVPEILTLDEDHLQRVIGILLKNAVAFTEKGTVTVSARMHHMGLLGLTVRDTGAGMPQETVMRLFQPFYQADSSDTRRHGGIGLGLALAKRLLDAMGGAITVDSAPDKGSCFEISLPVDNFR